MFQFYNLLFENKVDISKFEIVHRYREYVKITFWKPGDDDTGHYCYDDEWCIIYNKTVYLYDSYLKIFIPNNSYDKGGSDRFFGTPSPIEKINLDESSTNELLKNYSTTNHLKEILNNNLLSDNLMVAEYKSFNQIKEKRACYGIINTKGIAIAQPIYDEIEILSDETYLVKKRLWDGWVYGIIDSKGNIIIDCEYPKFLTDNSYYSFVNRQSEIIIKHGINLFSEKYILFSKNDEHILFNVKNKAINYLPYLELEIYKDGIIQVRNKDRLAGILNYSFEIVVPCIYGVIREFVNEIAQVHNIYHWGAIDRKGNEIIPFLYDSMETINEDIIKVSRNSLWGFLNFKGNEILPCVYSEIQEISNENFMVKKGNFWGLLDKNGNEITSCIYLSMKEFGYDLYRVQNETKWGAIDRNGKEIINIIYDELQPFKLTNLYEIVKYSKWFTNNKINIDISDSPIILSKYKFGDKRGYVDTKGKEYWYFWKDKRDYQ